MINIACLILIKIIKNPKIAVVGLGYVGLPLAVEFSRKYPVIGFDLDSIRINEIKDHYDVTKEYPKTVLQKAKNLKFQIQLNQKTLMFI